MQNPSNTPVMSGFERQIRVAVEAGQTVTVNICPVYKGTNLIPQGITMTATGSQGFSLSVSIPNAGK